MTDLIALLGRDHFDALCQAVGGTRLYIPKTFGTPSTGGRDTSSRLVALVGEPLAILLVFHFGPRRLYVPQHRDGPPTGKRVDAGKLKRLSRRLSARQVARRLGCSERTVEKHRARSRPKTLTRKGIDQ